MWEWVKHSLSLCVHFLSHHFSILIILIADVCHRRIPASERLHLAHGFVAPNNTQTTIETFNVIAAHQFHRIYLFCRARCLLLEWCDFFRACVLCILSRDVDATTEPRARLSKTKRQQTPKPAKQLRHDSSGKPSSADKITDMRVFVTLLHNSHAAGFYAEEASQKNSHRPPDAVQSEICILQIKLKARAPPHMQKLQTAIAWAGLKQRARRRSRNRPFPVHQQQQQRPTPPPPIICASRNMRRCGGHAKRKKNPKQHHRAESAYSTYVFMLSVCK